MKSETERGQKKMQTEPHSEAASGARGVTSDQEIEREVVAAVRGALPYSARLIDVTVEQGWVTLEGHLDWPYQVERAECSVRCVAGVAGTSNQTVLEPMTLEEEMWAVKETLDREVQMAGSDERAFRQCLRIWAKPNL